MCKAIKPIACSSDTIRMCGEDAYVVLLQSKKEVHNIHKCMK